MNIFYVKGHEYFSLVDLFDFVLYEKNNSQHDGTTPYTVRVIVFHFTKYFVTGKDDYIMIVQHDVTVMKSRKSFFKLYDLRPFITGASITVFNRFSEEYLLFLPGEISSQVTTQQCI